MVKLRLIYSTLSPAIGSVTERYAYFEMLLSAFRDRPSPLNNHLVGLMERFEPGLFVGDDDPALPADNLELEQWFRLPKGHERRLHGHAHAGVRIVYSGPTLLPTLDAHRRHPQPFTAEELIPSCNAQAPTCQCDAEERRRLMARARSRKQRPLLLAELEQRYGTILGK